MQTAFNPFLSIGDLETFCYIFLKHAKHANAL
uniref:Uncharacterized protein n=1 Tax=Arundo donax TaxID=35708 RepID=A0A0A8YUY7_ARUDO